MRVTVIAQVENATLIKKQIEKQTIKPVQSLILVDKSPEPDTEEIEAMRARRLRISQNHKELKQMVESYCHTDFIWQLEGDGVLSEDCLERLIRVYEKLESEGNKVGYVSGIQMGRHGLKCVGAWRFNEDGSFKSLNWNSKGLQTVDGSGFYCLLAKKDVWLKGSAEWNNEPYGPDVAFGLSLKKLGYNIYMDMTNWVGHKTEKTILYPDSGINVEFYRDINKWKYRVI